LYGSCLTHAILLANVYRIQEQDTQLLLTNRATHMCKCNGVADLKHPPHMCYHVNLVILRQRVYAPKGTSKLGTAEARPFGVGVADS